MARQYLTTKQVIDQAMSHIRDNSDALRVKMLAWFNSLTIQLANERSWNFLNTSASIAIVNSVVPLPDDFGAETSITVGSIILTPQNLLNPTEAFYWSQTSGILAGYTVDEVGITLYPTTTGTALLAYAKRVPVYSYDVTNTVFPTEFLPLLERTLLTVFYEYDVDSDRMPTSFQLDAKLMSQVKTIDNQRRSMNRLNPHGYKRSAI